MAFYIMWTWAYCHKPDGRCVVYYESGELQLLTLYPFSYPQRLIFQGTM